MRFRLLVGPDTPADPRLAAVLDALTEERDGEFFVRGVSPNELFLRRWTPGGAGRSASPR